MAAKGPLTPSTLQRKVNPTLSVYPDMALPVQHAAERAPSGRGANAEPPKLARRVLVDAMFLGVAADALLHDGFGLGLAVWMIVFAASVVYLTVVRGDRLKREQYAWLAAAVLFAGGLAWRGSEALQFYDFLAMLLALAILGASLASSAVFHGILGKRIRDFALAFAMNARHAAGGLVLLVFRDGAVRGVGASWRGRRGAAAARAALIALPLLLVFGLLFGAADPVFESLFSLPYFDLGRVASHVVVAGFYTWVVGGWLRGALVDRSPAKTLPEAAPFTLGVLEVTVVLGGLVALFALFVGVQIGWLFGGEEMIRSRTGLTYAQYARHGFFELVWVSLLVLPVLLGVRAVIRDDDKTAVRRHRQLGLALLALLGGIMASALGRMALYVHYYGLSVDRLCASVFMAWLAIVFAWLGVTVLRGRTRDFAAGMTITGFVMLAGLNAVNPDALVARVNVDRAERALAIADSIAPHTGSDSSAAIRPAPIDYAYLTKSLGGDAVDVVVKSLLAPPVAAVGTPAREAEVKQRCEAVRRLFGRWGEGGRESERDWRLWNAGVSAARQVIRSRESALRSVTCWDGGGEAPFGTRDHRAALPGEQEYAAPPTTTLSPSDGRQ